MLILLVIVALTLSSCSAMNLDPPKRWVNNNTLYSDKLPRLEIRVSKFLSFVNLKESDKLVESTTGASHTGKKTTEYFFKGEGKRLKIKIASLPQSTTWRMIPPDYSGYKGNIVVGHKKINGIRYATGIMVERLKGEPYIYKAYGRVVGETTRYQIYYAEKLKSEWENYDSSLFSRADQDFLSAFSDRADKSFTMQDYSSQKRIPSPQKQPNTKNTQRLAKLESLYLDGILTKDEYGKKRDKIINNMLDE